MYRYQGQNDDPSGPSLGIQAIAPAWREVGETRQRDYWSGIAVRETFFSALPKGVTGAEPTPHDQETT